MTRPTSVIRAPSFVIALLLSTLIHQLLTSSVRAQFVADGATATLANVTTNITGTVTVGTNGSFTLLTLADNALLANSLRGVIGQNATAKSNEVRLISSTARWQMNSTFVGSNGAFNRLVISNGAQVIATSAGNSGILGQTANSSNNLALVTGAGSSWSNAGVLNIGSSGANNQLVVSNGARVHSAGFAYVGLVAGSGNNRVTVTDAGSLWSSDAAINCGLNGVGNRLFVRNGGGVRDAAGFVGNGAGGFNLVEMTGAGTYWTNTDGFHLGSDSSVNQLTVSAGAVVFAGGQGSIGSGSGASGNTATVTDPGSMWVNAGELYVGGAGASNRLTVANGGTVTASNLFVGDQPTSTANRLVVDSGTLRVANAAGTGALDVRRGTNQLVSGLIETDRLVLTNFLGRFELLGGTLVTRGAFLTNGLGMVVGPAGDGPAFWDVRPGPSNHYVSLGVVVGNGSSSNQMLISGGALLTNGVGGFIGLGAGANGNTATVTGPGSRWRVAGQVNTGAGGAFNTLTVSAGGRVDGTNGIVGGSSNLVAVTGAGSVWSNSASLFVGETGPGNQLQVSGGGLVVAASGSLGQNAAASANTAQISGAGSEWRFSGGFNVGAGGALNQLLVSSGARVSDISGIIGNAVTGSNNSAVVTGPGSLWNNVSDFTVGSFGERNELLVSDGGMVVASSGGVGDSSAHNLAVVTGPGSVWSNNFLLNVGYFGHSNRVRIENGGLLVSGRATIGDTGRSNEVSLTGAGSAWNNQSDLTVGRAGRLNQLVVSDGTTALTGGHARIGDNAAGVSNAVVASGPGTRWRVTTNLFVGNFGSFNRLVVSNGAFVSAADGFVGREIDATNNLALVTGPGSVWSNNFHAASGFFGANNQLIVSNGASLFCRLGSIGFASSDNLAVVTGPGSRWIAQDDLIAGNGDGNRLVVANGGVVINDSGFIGVAGAGNRVTVNGAGSLWSNRFNLHVGQGGGGNRLDIQSGGTVFGSNVVVGRLDTSTSNRVVVSGGTLRATVPDGTGLLDVRRGTNVLNAGLVDVDNLVLTNQGVPVPPSVFGNSSSNNFSQLGPAVIYPSTIAVAGLPGLVAKVTVTLSNLSAYPQGIDMLLVSPAGQKVMLMSDAGDDNFPFGSVMLTFDDAATSDLRAQIFAGTYRPTDNPPDETMPSPAPAGPYSTVLSSFNGSIPNGSWSLYIQDDTGQSFGTLRGWSLTISTDEDPSLDTRVFEFNGGTLVTRGAIISNGLPFIVGGPGGVPAVWDARAGLRDNVVTRALLVGSNSSFNQLVIPSGVVVAGTNVIVGNSSVSSNNLLHVTGGTLRVLTPGAALDVRGGTNRIDAGLVDVLQLVVTNTRGQFEMFGGTLRTPSTTIDNGRVCIIGGGASLATFQMLGGTHAFDNNLTIATNGSLIGTGFVEGTVTVAPGGRLVPGAPIGNLDVDGSVILQGTVNLQIDKSGGVRTSDEVSASGAVFYNGTLNVTDIGTDVLAAGDRFFLFTATPYVGNFTTLNLPPLEPGLTWSNKLSVDGSIEVTTAVVSTPGFSAITHTRTNVVFAGTNGPPNTSFHLLASTNVTLPLSNWVNIATNQFNAGGGFHFTNAITPAFRQRFFQLRVP